MQLRHRAIRVPEIRNARREWSHRETFLLHLGSDTSGAVGYGEASPLPGFSRETIADVAVCLGKLDPARLRFSESLQSLPRALSPYAAEMPAAARFCVESALLTGLCAERGMTLEQGLRTLTGDASEAPTLMQADGLQSAVLLDVFGEGAEQRAVAASNQGARVFKVKIGRDVAVETRRLTDIVRELSALGRPVSLRLDANQALTLDRLRALARDWRELPIEYLEEPCSTEELTAADPTRPIGVPIAFDESLALGPQFLRPWLDSGQVRALVCKPMYLGGIAATWSWAQVASEYGAWAVMSHLFDGPWALSVYEAMARVLSPTVVHGLAPHAALPAWRRTLRGLEGFAVDP